MTTWVCTVCGKSSPMETGETVRFCPLCGAPQETAAAAQNQIVSASFVQHALHFLGEGDRRQAAIHAGHALEADPENAWGYLVRLMIETGVRNVEELATVAEPFAASDNYRKAVRFADEVLRAQIISYAQAAVEREEEYDREVYYAACMKAMRTANSAKALLAASTMFRRIDGYRDAGEQAQECYYLAATIAASRANSGESFGFAADLYAKIADYKDAGARANACYYTGAQTALRLRESEMDYLVAARHLAKIPGYKDADELLLKCRYEGGKEAFNRGNYVAAEELLGGVSGYRDADKMLRECANAIEAARKDVIYRDARKIVQYGFGEEILPLEDYQKALTLFRAIPGFKDADDNAEFCLARIDEIRAAERQEEEEKERERQKLEVSEKKRRRIIKGGIIGGVVAAALFLTGLGVWQLAVVPAMNYAQAVQAIENGELVRARTLLTQLGDYRDAPELLEEVLADIEAENEN